MSRYTPSEDELMWLLAEQDDEGAIEAFLRRYPQHRLELLRRCRLVRELKGSRPASEEVVSRIPRFSPRAVPERRSRPAWAWSAVLAVVLVGVGFGSYRLVRQADLRGRETPALARDEAPQKEAPSSISPLPRREIEATPVPPPASPPARVPEVAPYVRPLDRPVTLRHARISLVEAINEVVLASGIAVQIAPGTPNPQIVCDYRNVPALEILKDLGRNFGFTAFEQDDRTVLIIPARDPHEQAASSDSAGRVAQPSVEAESP